MLKELFRGFTKDTEARLDAEIARLRKREQDSERELCEVATAVVDATVAVDRAATQHLMGDISEAELERARQALTALERTQVETEARLTVLRHELARVDDARASVRMRAQVAVRDELLPLYHAAVRDLAAALVGVREPLTRVQELADQIQAQCGDPRDARLRHVQIDPALLGLAARWFDDFIARPENALDHWLTYAREHVEGV